MDSKETKSETYIKEQKVKPCCACPETKKARDTCFFDMGEEAPAKCYYLIKAHRECMRSYGFDIRLNYCSFFY
ncbi:hypothetical protein BB560_004071 [Smittium megazygosporum]|uniref:Cytochrome c oxidase copper chaperone n=1 Tax=Smittium megazygosporum TaxID=133381 RepID=A0A2T9ZA68_9FUNG|nr:hypothetical protein BB560_004071 [Smittium megazygosporum]